MKHLLLTFLFAALAGIPVRAAEVSTPSNAKRVENLTLDQALEMAESLQPEMAEAKARVEAAEGRAQQAGTFPNPDAIVGAQQIPFSGNAPNEKEYIAGVAQTIPLSRRLSQARQAELLDREVRVRGLEVKRRDIRKRVHSAFATALYQERAFQTQSEIAQTMVKGVTTTQARLNAGDALPEDVARVEMELARAKVGLARSAALREQSMAALATAIGDPALAVTSLAGTLDAVFEIPTLESLAEGLSANPEALRAEAEVRATTARIDLAKAERIPDIKVEALYHRLEGSRENTVDVGLSIPLPLFNRNQGRLREARAEVAAAEARSRSTQNELGLRLRESYGQLTASLANSRALKTEILSRAEKVLKTAEARYAAGDISLTEILPVRRDWASYQLDYLESLRDVMQAWGELRALTNLR
jgi:outer membrane protein, heavy metal efflux system